MSQPRTDGRVERGNQTRRLVLRRTVESASVNGLESLSLGRLATELKLSKSGIFALFGSKEELQLATVRAATKVYIEHVIQPSLDAPPGLARAWRLCEAWIAYSRERVFPGGCFFQTVITEFKSRPGVVQDAIFAARREWSDFVRQTFDEAVRLGEIRPEEDSEQLTYEVMALLEASNAESMIMGTSNPYEKAEAAIVQRLRSAAAVKTDFLPAFGAARPQ